MWSAKDYVHEHVYLKITREIQRMRVETEGYSSSENPGEPVLFRNCCLTGSRFVLLGGHPFSTLRVLLCRALTSVLDIQ